jgi:26S proteasome regulatory subunit N2
MEAVVDAGFSLSYRDQVLEFLFQLFPAPKAGECSPHIYAITRLLIILSKPSLTVPFLTSLLPGEKLLAYQFAFDLAEGGSQDFLESIRSQLPEGDEVSDDFLAFRVETQFTQKTKEIYDKLRNILTGQESIKLYLEFLKRNNHADLSVLKNTKVGCHDIMSYKLVRRDMVTGRT